MRAWVASYPGKYLGMADFDEPIFDLNLGFGVTIKRSIKIDIDTKEYESSKRIFLQRRVENILGAARYIMLTIYWGDTDDDASYAEIEADSQDLLEALYRSGFVT